MQDSPKNALIIKISAVALAALVALFAFSAPFLAVAIKQGTKRPVVVVDAGHGGADAGVVGVRTGARESDLNLKVARLLGEYLESGGIRVVYTRVNDAMHSVSRVKNNKKRADMFYRGDVINGAKPSAVISIHMNYYSSPSRRGAQAFFDASDGGGREYAEITQELLNRDINPELGGREYSALGAEKYLLSCSPYPTIIAECGFLSSPLDEARLIDSEFQSRLAYTLFVATAIFLNSRANATGNTYL